MLSTQVRLFHNLKHYFGNYVKGLHACSSKFQTAKPLEDKNEANVAKSHEIAPPNDTMPEEIYTRVVPMILNEKEPIILSFDDVPGPKSLKYLSIVRQYFSEIGTQVTAGLITLGLNFSKVFKTI